MINRKRIAVVMPAYNAAKTLEKTVFGPSEVVDIKILVDDKSIDETVGIAEKRIIRGRPFRVGFDCSAPRPTREGALS